MKIKHFMEAGDEEDIIAFVVDFLNIQSLTPLCLSFPENSLNPFQAEVSILFAIENS